MPFMEPEGSLPFQKCLSLVLSWTRCITILKPCVT